MVKTLGRKAKASVCLSLGSNLGDRLRNLQNSLNEIETHIGEIKTFSSVHETQPWGFNSENAFLNAIVWVNTEHLPFKLLQQIHYIEKKLGRIRENKQGYQSRSIDIDIIFYDDLIINHESLKIPHPLMHLRDFVLNPLFELSPFHIHPILQQPISRLRKPNRI